jgi:hypothetical protein
VSPRTFQTALVSLLFAGKRLSTLIIHECGYLLSESGSPCWKKLSFAAKAGEVLAARNSRCAEDDSFKTPSCHCRHFVSDVQAKSQMCNIFHMNVMGSQWDR